MKQQTFPGIRYVAFASFMLCLLGCSSFPGQTFDAEEAIQGTWTSAHSVAVYEIALINGEMTVKGHSSESGKELMIGDVSWDGETLEFTSYLPSTDFKVIHENRMRDRNTMTSRTQGKAAHTVIWDKAR